MSGGKHSRKRAFVHIDPKQVTLDTKLRQLLSKFRKNDWKRLASCTSCADEYPKKLSKFTGKYCLTCFVEREYKVIPQGSVNICGRPNRPTMGHTPAYHAALKHYEETNGSDNT